MLKPSPTHGDAGRPVVGGGRRRNRHQVPEIRAAGPRKTSRDANLGTIPPDRPKLTTDTPNLRLGCLAPQEFLNGLGVPNDTKVKIVCSREYAQQRERLLAVFGH